MRCRLKIPSRHHKVCRVMPNSSSQLRNFWSAPNIHSCIDTYAHSCLKPLSNEQPVFKQPNPCSNHEIRVLFEHGFYLKILKTDLGLFVWRYEAKRCGPVDVNVVSRKYVWRSILHADAILYKETQRTKYRNTIISMFLAHLSRRLTRWAYSIAMVRRPSVVVRRPASSSSTPSNLYISEASWPT